MYTTGGLDIIIAVIVGNSVSGLRGKHMCLFSGLENMAMTTEPKRKEVIKRWRKVRNKYFHNL
jgi:hypothetical protein